MQLAATISKQEKAGNPRADTGCRQRIERISAAPEGTSIRTRQPGVSVWLRMSALPDGTPARDDRMHVEFDTELELIAMIPFGE